MKVPSPMRMDTAAQITVALMPTRGPSSSSAPGESVRRTLGWKQPRGFERRALWMLTSSPSVRCEPRATLISGLPENFTPRPSEQPLSRASNAQRLERDPRPQLSSIPSVSDQLRDGMVTDYLKGGAEKS